MPLFAPVTFGQRNPPTGRALPADWGIGWAAAKAAAGARLVNVGCFGDSIAQGVRSSDFRSTGFYGAYVTALQGLYGDGGSGYRSVSDLSSAVAGFAGTGGAGQIIGSGAGGTSGSGWDSLVAGVNGFGLFPHVAASGVTLSDNFVRGTFIDIYWTPQVAGPHNFTYSVDGGGAVTVLTATNQLTIGKTTIGPLTDANHTLVITATVGQPVVNGWTGRRGAGILPVPMNMMGRQSGNVVAAGGGSLPAAKTNGQLSLADVAALDQCIIAVGFNDIGAGAAEAAVSANIAVACDYARSANALCDLIIVAVHKGSTFDINSLYQAYCMRMKALADAYGALFVNYWALGRNNYGTWNALNYWGGLGPANNGAAGADTVHPSNAGYGYMATTLQSLVTALVP